MKNVQSFCFWLLNMQNLWGCCCLRVVALKLCNIHFLRRGEGSLIYCYDLLIMIRTRNMHFFATYKILEHTRYQGFLKDPENEVSCDVTEVLLSDNRLP